MPYLDYMTPGILAQSVLFISIFYGIAIIWERDAGMLHKMLASPASRGALVLGKALSAGVRSFTQAFMIYGLALCLGVHLKLSALPMLGVILALLLGAAVFSTLSLIAACLVKTRERFMGIGQFLTMPLFFASNAIYPIALMPYWLQWLAMLNPLSYEVDVVRALMLPGMTSSFGLATDFAVLALCTVALVMVGARLYPRVVT
jgi:ABC-2 type transport system permease protein